MFFFLFFFSFLSIIFILYVYAGIYYALGSAEYCKFNNKRDNPRRENFWDSVITESKELKEALENLWLWDIILEFSDVVHSLIKYFIVEYLPEDFYCSFICWFPVFILILPCSIKLGLRFKKYGCIRNHKNKNNCDHICNYYSLRKKTE